MITSRLVKSIIFILLLIGASCFLGYTSYQIENLVDTIFSPSIDILYPFLWLLLSIALVAVTAGLDGVIAHGMLVMGLVGRAITAWVGVAPLRQFGVRFVNVTRPGQMITVSGQVVEKMEVGGEYRVRCEVSAADQAGQEKVKGSFVIALPRRR